MKATYFLEGDSPLALHAYEEIRKLYNSIAVSHFPNVKAIINQIAGGNQILQQQLTMYARSCVQPGFAYFKSKFDGDLNEMVEFFKATRTFSPVKMKELQVDSNSVDKLKSFPYFNSNPSILSNLKAELHKYLTAVEDIDSNIDITDWWKVHKQDCLLL